MSDYVLPAEVRDRRWAQKYLAYLRDVPLRQLFDDATLYCDCDDILDLRSYWKTRILVEYLWNKVEQFVSKEEPDEIL